MLADGFVEHRSRMDNPDPLALVVVGNQDEAGRGRQVVPVFEQGSGCMSWLNGESEFLNVGLACRRGWEARDQPPVSRFF
jgi:hypothetical protein